MHPCHRATVRAPYHMETRTMLLGLHGRGNLLSERILRNLLCYVQVMRRMSLMTMTTTRRRSKTRRMERAEKGRLMWTKAQRGQGMSRGRRRAQESSVGRWRRTSLLASEESY